MTPEELDQIEQRADAATPAPFFMKNYLPERMEDYEFLMASRQDIPRLVAEVRRLQAQLATAKEALQNIINDKDLCAEDWHGNIDRAKEVLKALEEIDAKETSETYQNPTK